MAEVDFVHTEEQEELRRLVRAFLADRAPVSEARRLMETPEAYDADVWDVMATQLGLQGLHLPERFGGAGFSPIESVLCFEAMGETLLCAPYFSTVALAANALVESGDEEACARLLPPIATGDSVATLAVCEDQGRWDESGTTLVATPGDGSEWVLDGHKSFVTDGLAADLLLVTGRSPRGVSLFAVEGLSGGITREAHPVMDLTRPLARLRFDSTPARLVGVEGAGWPGVERTLALGAIALAAEQLGGAQRCLDEVVAYAKSRTQFGRPIGSFQAIQHACADTLVAIESARSAVYYAAWVAAQRSPGPGGSAAAVDADASADGELFVAASLARVAASAASQRAAAGMVHFHGAMGFTWEHDAHLFFKRARSSALLLGDPTYHRGLLADRLGL